MSKTIVFLHYLFLILYSDYSDTFCTYMTMKGWQLSICLLITTAILFIQESYSQDIRINEVMSSNHVSFLDEDLSAPDWIELLNAGAHPVNLAGYGISNDIKEPFKWIFPEFSLGPGDYLLLAASGKDRKTIPVFWSTVISLNDEFRYAIPKADLGPWQARSFNDSSWTIGRSGFGYADGDDVTLVPEGTISILARKSFKITDPAAIKQMILHVDFDDSFVAYINGHEIARAEIGSPGIPPGWNQPALSSDHEASIYREGRPDAFSCDSVIKYLLPGDNLFAIEVHNANKESNDLSCIPFLSLGFATKPDSSTEAPSYLTLTNQFFHLNFKINSTGDTILLTNPSGHLADSIQITGMTADVSIGSKLQDRHSRWLFDKPTPGAANLSVSYPIRSGIDPVFSHKGGFITSPFTLEISGAEIGDTIWYTTDGSTPKRGSDIYKEPIPIEESKVIRAVITGPDRMNRRPVTSSYLYREAKPTLTTLSLSTDPPNFFDRDTGIYVLGPNASPEAPNLGANFWEDWERPIHIELYESEGTLVMESDAGVKIHGSWSRTAPQKSLSFYARHKYGTKSFNYRLFPDLPFQEYNNFLLRNSGNDWGRTMFRDALMCSLLDTAEIDKLAYRPASVYLNGTYWGLLNLREKINEHFLAAHHGVLPYQLDLLEDWGKPIMGDAEHYNNMIAFLENNTPALEANYDKTKMLMDVGNFMEYQIAEIYFDNYDWPSHNVKYWRSRTPEGKWRWIVFDTDVGFGLYDDNAYTDNTLEFALATNGSDYPNPPWATFLLRRLLENQGFKNQFINRFADRLNTSFSYQTVLQHIDQMSQTIADEIPFQLARWNLLNGNPDNWINEVEKLRLFASKRGGYMRSFICHQFPGLDTVSLNLSTSSPQSGHIKLNTLDLGSFPWEGIYFKNNPVQITALPNPGFRFVNWEGPVEEPLSASTTVDLKNYTMVKAVFEKNGSMLNEIVINEIFFEDSPDFNPDDWIELYNFGDSITDLSGWILMDDDSDNRFVIPSGTLLSPNDYLILSRNSSSFRALYPGSIVLVGDFSYGLGSTGDCVTLLNANQVLVDAVCFTAVDPWPSVPESKGVSIELIQPVYDNTIGANWQISAASHGTPGTVNSSYSPTGNPDDLQTFQGIKLECSPNPFSLLTRIRFEVQAQGWLRLSVYDLKGHLVKVLFVGESEPGIKELVWDGLDAHDSEQGSGVYICVLETKNKVEHCRLVILR